MAKTAGVYTGQAIALKVFPLFLALFAFLFISPWTSDYFTDIDPTQAFYTITLFFVGFSFLMEAIIAYPDTKSRSTGVFLIGFILAMILSLGSFGFGGAIITDYYDVMNDTSILAKLTYNLGHEFNYDKSSRAYGFIRDYFGPVNISRIKVRVLDQYGNTVDFNNNDFSFTLKCEQLYDLNTN